MSEPNSKFPKVSSCHRAELGVAHDPSPLGGTSYYFCAECREPCDAISDEGLDDGCKCHCKLPFCEKAHDFRHILVKCKHCIPTPKANSEIPKIANPSGKPNSSPHPDAKEEKGEPTKKSHADLSRIGAMWLYRRGCQIFANEVPTLNGYADALGIKFNSNLPEDKETVYYIEAKTSRSDLICAKQKRIYQQSIDPRFNQKNGIDFYYLIVADGVLVEPSLYPEWGVIDERGVVIRKPKRIKYSEKSYLNLTRTIAHVLVYKVFGKLYLPPYLSPLLNSQK